MVERVCFRLQLNTELVDEYVELHRAVWPKMLNAIERAGRRNYSIFLGDDGLLIGYYETDDDVASARMLQDDPDTSEWEAQSARFFVAISGTRADENTPHLREVFNLEEQLKQAG